MKSTPWDLLFVTCMLAGLVYCAVDLAVGGSGLGRQAALRGEARALEVEIAALSAERDLLAERARRLIGHRLDPATRARAPIAIDLDLLDERIRDRFGVARADEVLLIPPR